jgi:hypothetical protein
MKKRWIAYASAAVVALMVPALDAIAQGQGSGGLAAAPSRRSVELGRADAPAAAVGIARLGGLTSRELKLWASRQSRFREAEIPALAGQVHHGPRHQPGLRLDCDDASEQARYRGGRDRPLHIVASSNDSTPAVTVSTSFDGGQTWTQGGNNRRRAGKMGVMRHRVRAVRAT